jgi:hypothetical protein
MIYKHQSRNNTGLHSSSDSEIELAPWLEPSTAADIDGFHLSDAHLDESLSSSASESFAVTSSSEEEDDEESQATSFTLGLSDSIPLKEQYALQWFKLKYQFSGNEAQTTAHLQHFKQMLRDRNVCPDILADMPEDFQQLVTWTRGRVAEMVEIHACVKDHLLFRASRACHELSLERSRRQGLPRAQIQGQF